MNIADYIDRVESFETLTYNEQVKLLSYFHCISHSKEYFSTTDIKDEFENQKLKQPTNVSQVLKKLSQAKPPILLKDKKGWTFHRKAKKELDETYIGTIHNRDTTNSLRELLKSITGEEQKKFLAEAINCFDIKSFRAAIIMTWLLSLDILYEHILSKKLPEFNSALVTQGKYKKVKITKKDDFNDLKESDFIELCRIGRIITGDIKKILAEKLDFRNTCAHPNSVVVKELKAISFIDDLISNIIKKYQ